MHCGTLLRLLAAQRPRPPTLCDASQDLNKAEVNAAQAEPATLPVALDMELTMIGAQVDVLDDFSPTPTQAANRVTGAPRHA